MMKRCRKNICCGMAFILVLGLFLTVTPVRNVLAAEDSVPMYRLYYPDTHEHFYTASAYEKKVLTLQRGWVYEGIGWYAPKTGKPVYRLYNPYTTDHHYTMDVNEYQTLGRQGWKQEGIGWYSDPEERVPVYRQFSPKLITGTHNYSTDLNEKNTLIATGDWIDEEIGWYAAGRGTPAGPEDSWEAQMRKEIAGFYVGSANTNWNEFFTIEEDGTFHGANQFFGESLEESPYHGRVVIERMSGYSCRLLFADFTFDRDGTIYENGVAVGDSNFSFVSLEENVFTVYFPHTPLDAIPKTLRAEWPLLHTEEVKAAGETPDGMYVIADLNEGWVYVRWDDEILEENYDYSFMTNDEYE